MQAILKSKLDKDIQPYIILGACNPHFAYNAIWTVPHIGTMLPCNVILREIEEGITEVSAIDPVASMQAIDNKDLIQSAGEVGQKLYKVINALK
jgi:uncharacterized protein (DUF302 family)